MLNQFRRLDQLLNRYSLLWMAEPFHLSRESDVAWQHEYSGLYQWLSELSVEQIQAYKSDNEKLSRAIKAVFPTATELLSLCQIEPLTHSELTITANMTSGIPGRKLSQIQAMGVFALSNHKGSEWLEWCSGKGYLGRILTSQSQQPVTSFEWQESLCLSGQADADKNKLKMHFVQGDALSDSARAVFNPQQHAVALHACGDLHVKLLQNATEAGNRAITISPCCYHLTENSHYLPLSDEAKSSCLKLSRQALRIPLQETVTGGERVIRHRQQEMVFRLGLDSMLTEELNHQGYMPIPSIKKSELSNGFAYLCRWAAKKKQFMLSDQIDFDYWEKKGLERFWLMERLSLIQQLFRRPLEVWLALDKGLFLQQQGYQVQVGEFCPRAVTPRNILIHGCKQ